jgi:hypothetical protein
MITLKAAANFIASGNITIPIFSALYLANVLGKNTSN